MKDVLRAKVRAKRKPITKGVPEDTSVTAQPLFGMWSDRSDMTDPSAYVRNLRKPRSERRK